MQPIQTVLRALAAALNPWQAFRALMAINPTTDKTTNRLRGMIALTLWLALILIVTGGVLAYFTPANFAGKGCAEGQTRQLGAIMSCLGLDVGVNVVKGGVIILIAILWSKFVQASLATRDFDELCDSFRDDRNGASPDLLIYLGWAATAIFVFRGIPFPGGLNSLNQLLIRIGLYLIYTLFLATFLLRLGRFHDIKDYQVNLRAQKTDTAALATVAAMVIVAFAV